MDSAIKQNLIAEEPGATDIVEDPDGRLWYSDGVIDWRYEGQCTAMRFRLDIIESKNAPTDT